MDKVQEFIEKYYPNYHGCDIIAYLNDLEAIVDGEVVEDSSAYDVYCENGKDMDEIIDQLFTYKVQVMERAIANYMENYERYNSKI